MSSLEVMFLAFVMPFAAFLIVGTFVFVFCLRHEIRRCVGYCYCFGVLLYCCVAAIWFFFRTKNSVFFITNDVFWFGV